MPPVIVRFAPSPTGYLHVGGARTAIFNWLYARKHNGKFILRIEDTDTQRTTAASVDGILESMRWLGLDWDEGPNFQSHNLADHQAAAEKLLSRGLAYKCFCSKDELEEKRRLARSKKQTYQYDGYCRHLSPSQIHEMEADGYPSVLRFKVPRDSGALVFHDAVFGTIEKRYSDIEDFVILRADGRPLYVLSNSVDDIQDGITHVIRGQDGLANTPKQILIYQGLDASQPMFAHMSLTLDQQKNKISKRRHGHHVAIQYYRENGFLPWAVVNFLVLLGWSEGSDRELYSPEELIEVFDLSGINRTNSIFHLQPSNSKFFSDPKLMSINAHYLRDMPLKELLPFVRDVLKEAGLWDETWLESRVDWFESAIELIRSRC